MLSVNSTASAVYSLAITIAIAIAIAATALMRHNRCGYGAAAALTA
jgi:hypothetical protein